MYGNNSCTWLDHDGKAPGFFFLRRLISAFFNVKTGSLHITDKIFLSYFFVAPRLFNSQFPPAWSRRMHV